MPTYVQEDAPLQRRFKAVPRVRRINVVHEDDVAADTAWVRRPEHATAWWQGAEPQSPPKEETPATFTRWGNGDQRDARGILDPEAHGFLEAKAMGRRVEYHAPDGEVVSHFTCSTEHGKPHWLANEVPRRRRLDDAPQCGHAGG